MQAIIERCCGLDVHQETVVACLLIGAAGARARKEVRTFRTVRRELEALRDWLTAAGVPSQITLPPPSTTQTEVCSCETSSPTYCSMPALLSGSNGIRPPIAAGG